MFIFLSALPSERFFISVCCFLIFNVNDWLGRTVTTLIRWVSIHLLLTFVHWRAVMPLNLLGYFFFLKTSRMTDFF